MRLLLILATIAVSWLAYNYATQDGRSSPPTGLWRPFVGFVHLLAAIGVGAWGAVLRGPAVWALPVAAVVGAALGCTMAWNGEGQLPFVGITLLLSVMVLALAVVMPIRMPVEKAAAMVSLLSFYHGYAYGAGSKPVEAVLGVARAVVAA